MIKLSTYTISFLNGVLLLCLELVSSKIMAPYFGNSYQVWSTMLFVTLLSICCGYYLAGKLTQKNSPLKYLMLINAGALAYVSISYFFYDRILSSLVESSFYFGLITSFFVCFFRFSP